MKRIIIAGIALAGLCGCNSQSTTPSSTKPTQAQVNASVSATEQRIKEVQNDSTIPDSVKDQIIGRLKGNMDRTLQANRPGSGSTPGAQ